MPTVSEPRTEADSWTYNRCRAAFLRGTIGPETFRVTCLQLGMSPTDAASEVRLAEMEIRDKMRGRRND